MLDEINLEKSISNSQNRVLELKLNFKITGSIRNNFIQNTWEKAYDRFDNLFRVNTNVEIKSGRDTIYSEKFFRKAIFFWTRNPKITHRVWISIVKDDEPFYPLSEDEAKMLFFDFDKTIKIESEKIFSKNKNELYALINVNWGKHQFTEPTKITAKSNSISI